MQPNFKFRNCRFQRLASLLTLFLNWIQLSLLTQQQHDAHVDEHHLVPVLAGHQQVHVPQDQGGQLQHKNNPVRVDELGIFLRDEQNIKKHPTNELSKLGQN